MGFPSRIQDAPILSLLLGTTDTYPFAEERRLFYVALTRARDRLYICGWTNKKKKESQSETEKEKKFVSSGEVSVRGIYGYV